MGAHLDGRAGVFEEEGFDLGEEFPVSHVGDEEDDALSGGDRFVGEFVVFDVDDLPDVVIREGGNADGGEEVCAGAFVNLLGEAVDFLGGFFVAEGEA